VKSLAISLFTLLTGCSTLSAGEVSESQVMGPWCSGSENSYYEEFSLTIEDGKRMFGSWLHHRPESTGTWELTSRELSITPGPTYTVLSLSGEQMTVQWPGGEPELYVRHNCREVAIPDLGATPGGT
jgi:hypothetical protein